MNESRGHWYLLTGILLGAALGLLIAWVLAPVPYLEASPASLRADFKDEYRYRIAAAYAVNGNLGRARARLALLGDSDPIKALGDQSQRMLANNTAQEVVRSIAALSEALQKDAVSAAAARETATSAPQPSSPLIEADANPQTFTPTPTPDPENTGASEPGQAPPVAADQTDTATPNATSTPAPATVTTAPRPTHAPTSTPGPPFDLVNKSTFCEAGQPGLLQISLEDSSGQPVAGVELVITWAGGEEHFFSGLKPELGNGYADFAMSPNVEYALSLNNGGTRITGLSAPACSTTDGNSYQSIHLDFKQP